MAAVNSIGQGPYSTSSAPPRIPTFAAPTLNSFISIDPSTVTPPAFTRPFIINFSPTNCIDYYRTYIYIKSPYESFGNYYDDVNGLFDNLYTDLSNASQNTQQINNVYAVNDVSGALFYTNGPSQTFNAYCRTFNNDGYYVDSSINNFTTIAVQSGYTYNPPVLDPSSTNAVFIYGTGGIFNVVNATFTQISGNYIPNNNSYITRMDISAQTQTLSSAYNITDSSRFFIMSYSFATPSTFQDVYSGLNPPYNNNNASVARQTTVLLNTPVPYGNINNGGMRCRGGGSGSFTGGKNIFVRIRMYGQIRSGPGIPY